MFAMMRQSRYRFAMTMGLLMLLGLIAAGCVGGGAGTATGGAGMEKTVVVEAPGRNPDAPITVWLDPIRKGYVDKYKRLHPETANLINVEIVNNELVAEKVLLFNNAGGGWPDLVWSWPSAVALLSDDAHHFTLDLTDLLDQSILDDYYPGATPSCTINGRLRCLPSDLSHNVLWYDARMMKAFGYEVPATWEAYQALGDQVAREHPGVIIGTCGDGQCVPDYFHPSRCPIADVIAPNVVHISVDMSDPRCTRVAKMLDHLIANDAISTLSPFDTAFYDLVREGRLLMMTAPVWYGEYMFGGKPDSPYYQTAEGQLGVALPPKWQDQDKIYNGGGTGGVWAVSNHAQNLDLIMDMLLFLTTSHEVHDTAVTFPAYRPVTQEWGKHLPPNPLYAFDPFPVEDEAAYTITDEGLKTVRYFTWDPFVSGTISQMREGKTMLEALPGYGRELKGLAEAAGYEVIDR